MVHHRYSSPRITRMDEFERGVLVGLIIGEGPFVARGAQPALVSGMHVRHRELPLWAKRQVSAAKLYGPYESAGRRFYHWVLVGRPIAEFLPHVAHDIRALCPHV